MEFFIKKNSTLPVLKVQIFKDTRNNFLQFDNGLSGATITFSMYDEINNVYKITDSPASLELVPDSNPPAFFVVYQFNKTQTKKSGSYIGEFKITQSTHESILPIREKLYINVTESFVDTDFCCRPNRGERIIIRPSQTPKPSFTPTPTNTPTRTLTPTPSFTPTATQPLQNLKEVNVAEFVTIGVSNFTSFREDVYGDSPEIQNIIDEIIAEMHKLNYLLTMS